MSRRTFGWPTIFRLGLVQASLGAIVVLTTSTLNRVMVVELSLPALLPGLLVGIHYALQVLRPRLGYGSDVHGRRTPWILGGMAMLAVGGALAAVATALMGTSFALGVATAVLAFALIGVGVGCAGTTLLVLLAKRVDTERRAGAATVVWLMMIFGFIITTAIAGNLLDPYSPARLVGVVGGISVIAFLVSALALWRVEGPVETQHGDRAAQTAQAAPGAFKAALAEVWNEPNSRRFAVFVFVSMLAYSAQDLILEPFAGAVFGMTPGESTKLASIQHSGVLVGMILVALASRAGIGAGLRPWIFAGCIGSGLALIGLAAASYVGPEWPLRPWVCVLGFANGVYAVAAIGSMMARADQGAERREGVRLGLWGAAQALAFGLGSFIGTAASDVAQALFGSPVTAYAVVFAAEGLCFLAAAVLAVQLRGAAEATPAVRSPPYGSPALSPKLARTVSR
jgi:MFS transporter, BCD family, chlorophyll transporter